jgi:hypothetical protein
MENNVREIVNDIRNMAYRFELLRKSFITKEHEDIQIFNGPFGNSNKESIIKNLEDAEKVVSVLESKLQEVEKIVEQEKRFRLSKIIREQKS